jgi:hypothetical protein
VASNGILGHWFLCPVPGERHLFLMNSQNLYFFDLPMVLLQEQESSFPLSVDCSMRIGLTIINPLLWEMKQKNTFFFAKATK